jgi:THO complex subunit 1
MESFKGAVNAVLPVISEATKKERAMMGSKSVSGALKRKRDLEVGDDASRDYFFAKFLTSPELLDLEVRARTRAAVG